MSLEKTKGTFIDLSTSKICFTSKAFQTLVLLCTTLGATVISAANCNGFCWMKIVNKTSFEYGESPDVIFLFCILYINEFLAIKKSLDVL